MKTQHALNLAVLLFAAVTAASAPAEQQVAVDAAMNQSAFLAGEKQTGYLRVAMTGFEVEEADRTPVNVAIVLDKSGSMGGEKIQHAREAAVMAIQRLRADDIVSVVVYDTTVNVLVPATKLSNKEAVIDTVRSISAGGNTALFAGVSRGANEVRKFHSKNCVNRVILLSDGLANVGPSAPSDLAELGQSLGRENISVTTIGLGLGYNEDLMTQLAMHSDGNHMFAETPTELAGVFDAEFGDVLAVVAQDVLVTIELDARVRPVRGLGREVEITGQRATARLNQLYAGQMKYALLEVELPAYTGEALLLPSPTPIATVGVTYVNMKTQSLERIFKKVAVRLTAEPDEARASVNKDIMASAVEQIALEKNRWALELRDEGKIDQAREALLDNAQFLNSNAIQLHNEKLKAQAGSNEIDAQNLDPGAWARQRKLMRSNQYRVMKQQADQPQSRQEP
ncbi:MAG TPA: VWA domain-containing protein [Candidatus Hydrogenedentes bacterium]|nr:VWA domain-containing protein [Candidatus Hydrogenedentota bacterium]